MSLFTEKILHRRKRKASAHDGWPSRRPVIVSTNTEGETVVDIDALFQDEAFLKRAKEFKDLFDRLKLPADLPGRDSPQTSR